MGEPPLVSLNQRPLSSVFLHQALLHDLFIQTTRTEMRTRAALLRVGLAEEILRHAGRGKEWSSDGRLGGSKVLEVAKTRRRGPCVGTGPSGSVDLNVATAQGAALRRAAVNRNCEHVVPSGLAV